MTRAIILTLDTQGGIGSRQRMMQDELRSHGWRVDVASYATYPKSPELSVPSWRSFRSQPSFKIQRKGDGSLYYQVGCYLPELEWKHYTSSSIWNEITAQYDLAIGVSASVLPALPAVACNLPCFVWAGTPYMPDRKDRIREFSLPRRILDFCMDQPVCRYLERYILNRAFVTVTSAYCENSFEELVPGSVRGRIPVPLSHDKFAMPSLNMLERKSYRIGFAGRYDDHRKNLSLLFSAARICRECGLSVELILAGGSTNDDLKHKALIAGLESHITWLGHISCEELAKFYRSLDVFVIPSWQEGFAIVGIEAMAAGCPVVSTRCGGPEEYVLDGETGTLVDFSPRSMADAIIELLSDRRRHMRIRASAYEFVRERYSVQKFQENLWAHIEVSRVTAVAETREENLSSINTTANGLSD